MADEYPNYNLILKVFDCFSNTGIAELDTNDHLIVQGKRNALKGYFNL
jgi:hypothetical protein